MKRSKKDRRTEAEERQMARDKRTPQQQLNRLDELGCEATKERKRLEEQIEKGRTK